MFSHTPRGRIRGYLRQMWLKSRERAEALKRTNYCCSVCGVKQSKAKGKEQKIEVHHKDGIDNFNVIIDLIMDRLLCDPKKLEPLCPICHDNKTYNHYEKDKLG